MPLSDLLCRDAQPLSKHVQVIGYVASMLAERRCIRPIAVSCPRGVAGELFEQFAIMAPQVDVAIIDDTTEESVAVFRQYDLFFTSAPTLVPRARVVIFAAANAIHLTDVDWDVSIIFSPKSNAPPVLRAYQHICVGTGLNPKSVAWIFEEQLETGRDTATLSRDASSIFSPQIMKRELMVGVVPCEFQRQRWRQALALHSSKFALAHNSPVDLDNIIKRDFSRELRAVLSHPFLMPGAESQCEIAPPERNRLLQSSGKIQVLDQLLAALKLRKRRALILCNNSPAVDILDDYLHMSDARYLRVDESLRPSSQDRVRVVRDFNQGDAVAFLSDIDQAISDIQVDTLILFESNLLSPLADLTQALGKISLPASGNITIIRLMLTNFPEEAYLRLRASITDEQASSARATWKEKPRSLTLSHNEVHQIFSRGVADLLQPGPVLPKPEPGTFNYEPNLLTEHNIRTIFEDQSIATTNFADFSTVLTKDFAGTDETFFGPGAFEKQNPLKIWGEMQFEAPLEVRRPSRQLAEHLISVVSQSTPPSPSPRPVYPNHGSKKKSHKKKTLPVTSQQEDQTMLYSVSGAIPPPPPRLIFPAAPVTRAGEIDDAGPSVAFSGLSPWSPASPGAPEANSPACRAPSEPAELGHPPSSSTISPATIIDEVELLSAVAKLQHAEIDTLALGGVVGGDCTLSQWGLNTLAKLIKQRLASSYSAIIVDEDGEASNGTTKADLKFSPKARLEVEVLLRTFPLGRATNSDCSPQLRSILSHRSGSLLHLDEERANQYCSYVLACAVQSEADRDVGLREKVGLLSLIQKKTMQEPFTLICSKLGAEWAAHAPVWSAEKDRLLLVGALKHGKMFYRLMRDPSLLPRKDVEQFMIRKGHMPSSRTATFDDAEVVEFLKSRYKTLQDSIVAEAMYINARGVAERQRGLGPTEPRFDSPFVRIPSNLNSPVSKTSTTVIGGCPVPLARVVIPSIKS